MSLDNIQKYQRVYDYISDYHRLLYDYYSKHAVAFQVTYYNYDVPNIVWDDDQLYGGSYETTGDLSGKVWNKILLLPVYFMEEVSTAFDGQETGYVKEGRTSFVIPSTYGITPYPGDFVKFNQTFLRQENDIYPIFKIEGVEIHPNTDYRQWKLIAQVYQSKTTEHVDRKVSNVYSFVEYDKKIHTLADAQFMTKLLIKNEELRSKLKNYFDQNSGFYFIT
jgi:hypothetical protein